MLQKNNKEDKKIVNSLRSHNTFDFKSQCIFCGIGVGNLQSRRKNKEQICEVRTLELKTTIDKICHDRKNDEWSHQIQGRISSANDLHAADAVYHQVCSVNFRTGKNMPKKFKSEISEDISKDTVELVVGSQPIFSRRDAFLKVMNEIKDTTSIYRISDLSQKMREILKENNSNEQAYSNVYMKSCIQNHFGTEVIISKNAGKSNIVTFVSKNSSIMEDEYKKENLNQIENIIVAAAEAIKREISKIECNTSTYPLAQEMDDVSKSLYFLPKYLYKFLELVIGVNKKTQLASIGQAIIQTARPNSILAPLQLGLAVQMHHHFASRFLIESLHKSGFCIGYREVLKYLKNAAVTSHVDMRIDNERQTIQFAADNVDHNVRTIDGYNTFHGMGMVAIISPGSITNRIVHRNEIVSRTVTENNIVDIIPYTNTRKSAFYFKKNEFFEDISVKYFISDILYKLLPLVFPKVPGWSGFMNMIYKSPKASKSSVVFLPIIDMNPTDATCIYSTLKFLAEQAKKNNVTPIITFDQPLWWKSHKIICAENDDSELKKIIIMMGGLHTEMNFLGCIGYVMESTGIHDVLETIYAKNSIQHMMSGMYGASKSILFI